MLAVSGVVGAVWIDAELKGGDGGKVNGVVLDLLGRALGGEGELLAKDFLYLAVFVEREDGELLGTLSGEVDKVQMDVVDCGGLVKVEADELRTFSGGAPAGRRDAAECMFDREEGIFGGDLDGGDGVEVEPGAVASGRRLSGCG